MRAEAATLVPRAAAWMAAMLAFALSAAPTSLAEEPVLPDFPAWRQRTGPANEPLQETGARSGPAPERRREPRALPSSSRPLILAHYMPWYSARPFSDQWGWHWTMNHFDPERATAGRREIASHYYPMIGPYDSGDPHVLEYHLLLMKLAGIDGVIVDWYGLTRFRDYAVLHRNTTRLLQQCERLNMRFLICYEDQTIPAMVKAGELPESQRVEHAAAEIRWLHRYWFQSPSYVKLQGKPVLLSFGHDGLTDAEWSRLLGRLEFEVAYFSQDKRRAGAAGGFGWPAPRVGLEQVDRFLADAAGWPASIPAAFPRFHDIYREAEAGEGFPRLPDRDGQTLRSTLRKALGSAAPIVQLATWNDWGEGTQIEPCLEHGRRDLEIVQQILPQHAGFDTPPRVGDLAMPEQILRLRRAAGVRSESLDALTASLSAGRLAEARQALLALSPAPR